MPQTAVITRTKNRPLLLARAAQSVIAQSNPDFLWVVVNDGGDPETVTHALNPFGKALEGRLLRVDLPGSVGRAAAYNAGVRVSDSRFLAGHDDDDSWHPDFLARTTRILAEAPDPWIRAAVTYSTAIQERIEGDLVIELSRRSLNSDLRNLKLVDFLRENRTPNHSYLFERSIHEELGFFDETLPVLEDWEFLLRFYSRFEAILIREHLANYHFRPGTSPGEYANSTTGGVDLHGLQHQLLWNRLLREDLARGTFGLGAMAGIVQTLDETSHRLDFLAGFLIPAMRAKADGRKEVIICGAGLPGHRALAAARLSGLRVLAFTDRDVRLVGSCIEGTPVVTLEAGLKRGVACIIGSFNRAEEIAQDLRSTARGMGLPRPEIYLAEKIT